MHLAVAHPAAAVRRSWHPPRFHQPSLPEAGSRLSVALLQKKCAVHRVQHVAQCEVDSSVLRIKLETALLPGRPSCRRTPGMKSASQQRLKQSGLAKEIEIVSCDRESTIFRFASFAGRRAHHSRRNQLGTKSRAHGGQQTKCSRLGTPILHHVFKHAQHRGGRKISYFTQAIPGSFQLAVVQSQRIRGSIQNFWSAGMQHEALSDRCACARYPPGKRRRRVPRFSRIRVGTSVESMMRKPFSEMFQPIMSSVSG